MKTSNDNLVKWLSNIFGLVILISTILYLGGEMVTEQYGAPIIDFKEVQE